MIWSHLFPLLLPLLFPILTYSLWFILPESSIYPFIHSPLITLFFVFLHVEYFLPTPSTPFSSKPLTWYSAPLLHSYIIFSHVCVSYFYLFMCSRRYLSDHHLWHTTLRWISHDYVQYPTNPPTHSGIFCGTLVKGLTMCHPLWSPEMNVTLGHDSLLNLIYVPETIWSYYSH